MRFLVHYGKTFTVLLFLFPFLGLSASYLYFQYQETQKEVLQIMQTKVLDDKNELLKIYVTHLENAFGKNFIEVLRHDKAKRILAEKELQLLKGSEVQYLYLLYIDPKGNLRYLLDTTQDIDEKGEFQQRFIPQKDIWQRARRSKIPESTAQKEIDKLWISMAYPIVYQHTCIALIGIDFSHKEHIQINKTLVPLENIYFYSALFVLIMFTSAFVQLIIYYKHRKKSFIDPLTGMYNRQYLHELLKKFPLDAFQILIMDLDHFKQVNDLYGHDAGDHVLQTVSQRIQSVVRKKDILIRYGGEEFLLLIADKDPALSHELAQRVRQQVKAEPITLKECLLLHVTISMGLNPYPEASTTFEHAVKIADLGLYKAKHLGRDRVEVYDDELREEDPFQELCHVQKALKSDKVYCMYQPIFNTQTRQISSYELLIRMQNSENKVIIPAHFLSSIRSTPLYIELTRRVLLQAFETLTHHDVTLNMNLDLQDLFNDEIVTLFTEIFEHHKDLGKRLTIEIRDKEEIFDIELISQCITSLKALGMNIAIDNFGSGYANFRYLLNMDIDILKIDGTLIKAMRKDNGAYKIVHAIETLASDMNIQTVAEHVETQEILDCVKQLGITSMQGYFLAKPIEKLEE